MIKLFEFAECLIAGVLLLVVIAGLPGVRNEGAFQLAYAVLVVDVVLLGAVLKHALAHPQSFSRFRYLVISGGMAVVSWLAFFVVARLIDATDSSHGGSVWVLLAGSTAFVLFGSVLMARRKRNL